MVNRIFGIVGWLGTAIVFGAVGVRFLRPEWDQYSVYAAYAGLACVILYTLSQWREVGAYFKQRNARYGALAGLSVLVVLGILVAVNYVSSRQNKRWDLTENQQYSLSEQTIKLLQGLDAPVRFLVFDRQDQLDRFRTRLTEYEYQSDRVDVEYVDVDRQPVRAREYEVDVYGTVVIEYMGRTERVVSDTEQDLTNGLIKVLTGTQKKVYFVQGHGEKDTADSGRTGYSAISDALGRDNYSVEALVLAQQQDVPEDASVVAIVGPTADLFPPEAEMLGRYLAKGGHLLVLLDPPEGDSGPMPVLEGLLRDWSVDVGNNVVVDVSGMGQLLGTDASVPVAAAYPSHALTEGFALLTAYPLARTVAPTASATAGRVARPIINTGPRSWAEVDVAQLRASGEVSMDAEAGDTPGPVSIGVAVTAPVQKAAEATESSAETEPSASTAPPAETEADAEDAPQPESRLVVIGDSDFGANYALGIQGNRDLFMNAVNWLAQQEDLIAIRPREAGDRRVTLTARRTQGIFWMSLLFVPAAVFGTGIYTWWRRR